MSLLPDNPQVLPSLLAGAFGEGLTTYASAKLKKPLLLSIAGSLVVPFIEGVALAVSLHQKDMAGVSQASAALLGSLGGAVIGVVSARAPRS